MTGDVLAPEEPDVYRHRGTLVSALRRSAMFLEAEGEIGLRFAPLERDLSGEARSINISSLRDEEDCKEK